MTTNTKTSKQSAAKEKQGYKPKAIPQTCGNCAKFKSDMIEREGFFGKFPEEKNMRCEIGGFAVKKMGTCNEWERKAA